MISTIGKTSIENARLTFNLVVNEVLQEMVDTHFKFYKHVNDDQSFANAFLNFLFEHYQEKTDDLFINPSN
jgi:hypothetical protein